MLQVPHDLRRIGSAATKAQYRLLLAQVNALLSSHHASSDFADILNSRLVLANGDTITLRDLLMWRYRDLDEVILSCCETGLGQIGSLNDEILTLSTGFLCMGARRVISTLWGVYDDSTAYLTILYNKYRKEGKSMPISLQKAQQDLRTMTGSELKTRFLDDLKRFRDQGNLSPQGWHRLTKAMSRLRSFADDEIPLAHPVHWASFVGHGLS